MKNVKKIALFASLLFISANFSANCLAAQKSDELTFSPKFYGSLSLDNSQIKISSDSNIAANQKGNNSLSGTISFGLQQNLISNFYINAEGFYAQNNSKTNINGNELKIKSNYGILARFGYKFVNKVSIYLGSGISSSQYQINSNQVETKNLKTGIFIIGASYDALQNVQIYFDSKYFKTKSFQFSSIQPNRGGLEYNTYSIGARLFFN